MSFGPRPASRIALSAASACSPICDRFGMRPSSVVSAAPTIATDFGFIMLNPPVSCGIERYFLRRSSLSGLCPKKLPPFRARVRPLDDREVVFIPLSGRLVQQDWLQFVGF